MSRGDSVATNDRCPLTVAIAELSPARFELMTELSGVAGGGLAWPRAAASRMKHSVKRAMEKPSFALIIAPFRAVEAAIGTNCSASFRYDESGTTNTALGDVQAERRWHSVFSNGSETRPPDKKLYRRRSDAGDHSPSYPTHLPQGFPAKA